MKRVLVFDVGGVIVRWQPLELMRAHLPMAAPEEAMRQVFQAWAPGADWLDFDLGRVEPDELAERIAARTGYPRAAVASLIAAVPHHLQPMPESVALIERVRAAGHRLALLSNMPRTYADHLEATHDCFGWFDQRVWSGRVGLVKPERAIFEHLQSALGIAASQALFLDDHGGNVEAARALGWHALHFESAGQAQAGLRAQGLL
jgi:putative hydrolase of the HAD superfamily